MDAHPLMCAGPTTSSEATVLIQTKTFANIIEGKNKQSFHLSVFFIYMYIYIG